MHKVNKSDKSLIIRNYRMSPHQRVRGKTIYNKSSLYKDKYIKTYKKSLFNKNTPKKAKTKDNVDKDNIKGIKYKGISQKYLLMGLEYKEKEDKNENTTITTINNSLKKKY
jgi:hypothetical protein